MVSYHYGHISIFHSLLSSQNYRILLIPSQSFQKLCIKLRTKFKFTGIQGSIIWGSSTFSLTVLPPLTLPQPKQPSCYSSQMSSLFYLRAGFLDTCRSLLNVRGCSVYSALPPPTYSTTLHIAPLYFSSQHYLMLHYKFICLLSVSPSREKGGTLPLYSLIVCPPCG